MRTVVGTIIFVGLVLCVISFAYDVLCTVKYQSKILTIAVSDAYTAARGKYNEARTKANEGRSPIRDCRQDP